MATAAPKVVSPFIKFCRYSALAAGITYGFMRYRYLSRKEVKIQEYEDAVRARIAVKKQAQQEKATFEEMQSLGKDCGIPSAT